MQGYGKPRKLLLLLLLPSMVIVVTCLLHKLPSLASSSRPRWLIDRQLITLVAARSKEDTSWLDLHVGNIHSVVYQASAASTRRPAMVNKGNEAMPYLQYIIENYGILPNVSVFSHGAM